VLLHDADEHEDADHAVDVEFHPEDHEGDEGAAAGGWEARENRERVDEAFVEDAEDEVDDEDGHDQEEAEALHGGLERLRGALKAVRDGCGNLALGGGFDLRVHFAEGGTDGGIVGKSDGGELAEVLDGERADVAGDLGDRAEGYKFAAGRAD